MLKGLMVTDIRIAERVMVLWRGWGLVALLVCVYWRDIGSRISMRIPCLLSMTDEIFEVLDGRHGRSGKRNP